MPETDPQITPRCPSCGSDAIVPDVVVYAASAGALSHAGVYTRPGALVNKQLRSTPAQGRACSDCGLLMLVAEDPHALWEAHMERLANDS